MEDNGRERGVKRLLPLRLRQTIRKEVWGTVSILDMPDRLFFISKRNSEIS
jgi:hypothetical protein